MLSVSMNDVSLETSGHFSLALTQRAPLRARAGPGQFKTSSVAVVEGGVAKSPQCVIPRHLFDPLSARL
jgi:hypothetical protein